MFYSLLIIHQVFYYSPVFLPRYWSALFNYNPITYLKIFLGMGFVFLVHLIGPQIFRVVFDAFHFHDYGLLHFIGSDKAGKLSFWHNFN